MNNRSDDDMTDLGIGSGTLARIIGTSLDMLESRLRDHAAANDGTVPLNALRQIRESVDPQVNREMRALIRNGWHDMRQAARREHIENKRRHPLERLIIQRFDYLLAPHGHPPIQRRTMSRRIIPAFISALQQMIGPELYEEYEKRCQDIVDAARNRMGDSFAWSVVYADAGAHVLVTDILVYIARYFDDIEHRQHWMEEYFESVMVKGETEEERRWAFEATEFYLLLDALYHDLQRGTTDPHYAERLKKRYGDANLAHVWTLIDNIDADRNSSDSADEPDTTL